jgi:hypothetical protein
MKVGVQKLELTGIGLTSAVVCAISLDYSETFFAAFFAAASLIAGMAVTGEWRKTPP